MTEDPTNFAESPTMAAALEESFGLVFNDHSREQLFPDRDSWRQGQDEWEAMYWRGMGE